MHTPLALSTWHIGHGVSQVRGQSVAGGKTKRRRYAFLASPATGIGLRSKKASQVRHFLQTCDENAWGPRRKRTGPATQKGGTCDDSTRKRNLHQP